jgi:hypothetical protein
MSKNDKIKEYRSVDFDGTIAGQGVNYDSTGTQITATFTARPQNRKRILPGLVRREDDNSDDPFRT